LEIEALNENIGRWETTWFTFIYCIYSVLIWWGTAFITYFNSNQNQNKSMSHSIIQVDIKKYFNT